MEKSVRSPRSPVLGYNHNIQFHGHVFHVQTEDSGVARARVFTHLFFEGTILASKKHEYESDAQEDAVRLVMQGLHKAMIKELKEGLHDPRILAFFAARGEPITLGDRPSLVQAPAVVAAPAVAAPARAAPPAGVPDRPLAVSGSIEAVGQPKRGDSPAPAVTTPPPARRPVVVVKPQELRRPPVVVSSSAEGVVVKRNVVINVGGGSAPVQGQISRGAAMPRPAIPYVVREGSYPLPTASRGSGPHQPGAQQPPPPSEVTPSARDVRMPWDGGASPMTSPTASSASGVVRRSPGGAVSDHTPQGRAVGATDAAMRTRTPGGLSERTPAERAPVERAFADRAFADRAFADRAFADRAFADLTFGPELSNDKSLDEVILEYLSDDAE